MGSSAIPGSAKEHSLTDQRFDAIDQRFDAIDQRFDAIDRRFDAIDQRFDAIDRRLDAIDQRLDALDSKVDTQAILLARLDTKMNIIMGMLGVAAAGASFLLIRLLLG